MTESAMTETAVTETVVTRTNKRAFAGVISNIETVPVGETAVTLASLTTTYLGKERVYSLSIDADVLPRIQDMMVEGTAVRLYGEQLPEFIRVIGPDQTKRTLAREAAKFEMPAAPAPKAAKPKRVMTEAQRNAWNTIILPKMQEGRARKAAERAAAEQETVA